MEAYKLLIEEGWTPSWTGIDKTHRSSSYTRVLVRMARGANRLWHKLDLSLETPEGMRHLVKHTAVSPGSCVGVLPSMASDMSKLRAAAIMGIAPFSKPGLGIGEPLPLLECPRVAGLDIEQSTHYRGGLFPLPHDPLISIAIVTWESEYVCGYVPGVYDPAKCCPTPRHQVIQFASSQELADWAVQYLLLKLPDFVCIHNGFKYDISVLAAHCSNIYSAYFVELNLGKAERGYDFAIPGCTVVDTFLFLQKLHNAEHASLGLDALALSIGERGKLKHPSMRVDVTDKQLDLTQMIRYNLHDAYLHVRVAVETRCIEEICTMCAVFRSPISDITRFISGTSVCSMASSYALSQGCLVDWSDEIWQDVSFKGGYVLSPVPGLHRRVHVLDFASMYPSIMIAANLSPETIYPVENRVEFEAFERQYGLSSVPVEGELHVRWDSERVVMRTCSTIFYSDLLTDGIARKMCRDLIARRKSLPDKSTAEGWTLKIGTNSIYGVFGSSVSGLSSILAAIAVTGIGRLLLSRLVEIATEVGYEVLYGDTDSVFVSSASGSVTALMEAYGAWARSTPFSGVRLEVDKEYSEVILVRPKMYYGQVRSGKEVGVVMKGMASKRRDRPDISREALQHVCGTICSHVGEERTLTEHIARYLMQLCDSVRRGDVAYSKCMKEVRVEGVSMYSYRSVSQRQVFIEKAKFDGRLPEAIDMDWLVKSIESSLAGILAACELPSVARLVEFAASRCTDLDALL